MDLHPITVHFPIALLTLYTFVQMIPPKKVLSYPSLFTLQTFLLITGSATLLLARQTGDAAGHTQGVNVLVHTHETWATLTTGIYGIITIFYFLLLFTRLADLPAFHNTIIVRTIVSVPFYNTMKKLIYPLFYSGISTIVSVIGFVGMLITGALGGAIVYGPNTDPIVHLVYTLLVQ